MNCTVPEIITNVDITGTGVTIAFIAQVVICTAALLPIRFLRVYKPKMSEEILQFMEPVLSNATDYMAITCNAHIITAMYSFPTLTFDQVHRVLSLHWPAALLFLVSTGVLWPNFPHAVPRLAMQSGCIAFVFGISVRATVSSRLKAQMACVQLLLDQRGSGSGSGSNSYNFQRMFKISVMMFPTITLLFWIWTLAAVAVAQRRPFSKLRRFMNVYADVALLFMPVAIVLVAVNISQDDKRLAQLHQGRPAGLWSFGQFFSLLMVAGSLFEVYKGFMGYIGWKKEAIPATSPLETVCVVGGNGMQPEEKQVGGGGGEAKPLASAQ